MADEEEFVSLSREAKAGESPKGVCTGRTKFNLGSPEVRGPEQLVEARYFEQG